jgi:hypothetical protein
MIYLPLRMLAEGGRENAEAKLADVLPRLRCRVCGDEPAIVAVVENVTTGMAGGRAGEWSCGRGGGGGCRGFLASASSC